MSFVKFVFDNGKKYSTVVPCDNQRSFKERSPFLSAVERTSMALMGFNFKPNPTLSNRIFFYFSLFSGP